MNRRGPLPSEWVWAGVNFAFVIIAGTLFFSIDDPVLGTVALAAALLAGEYCARAASSWVRTHTNGDF